MLENLTGPWLLTAISLTCGLLAIACFIAYVLNKNLPYDSDIEQYQSGSASKTTAAYWRSIAIVGGAFWLVILIARFAFYSSIPGGAEWLQAGATAAVVTGLVAQGAYLLGALAKPDEK